MLARAHDRGGNLATASPPQQRQRHGAVAPRLRMLIRLVSASSPAQYNGVWHCIVGRNFGSYVTNEQKHYIYFYQGQTAVLLFKTN